MSPVQPDPSAATFLRRRLAQAEANREKAGDATFAGKTAEFYEGQAFAYRYLLDIARPRDEVMTALEMFHDAAHGSDAEAWEVIAETLALQLRDTVDSDGFCIAPDCWATTGDASLWCPEHAPGLVYPDGRVCLCGPHGELHGGPNPACPIHGEEDE